MPSKKKDATAELAEKMVQTLRHQKQRGDVGPLTLEQLAQLADATAGPRTILAAVHPQRKAFSPFAVVARKDLRAPVALLEDLPQLAASSLLLEFLLTCTRTASTQAASAAELKAKVTRKLQKPFQEALTRQIEAESLPSTVGWVLIKNARKLFLLSDLHTGRRERGAERGEPGAESRERGAELRTPYSVLRTPYSVPGTDPRSLIADPSFGQAFEQAFQQLDRQGGGHNFVSLVALRKAVPMERTRFDAQLRQLRLAGRYTLSAAEGRHGLSLAEQEAGITEDGTLLLYVSRKLP